MSYQNYYDYLWNSQHTAFDPTGNRPTTGKLPMKITRKFYCGAKEITTNNWAKETEAEVIEHARELLNADSTRDHVAIVRIIKIVQRKQPEITVKVVK